MLCILKFGEIYPLGYMKPHIFVDEFSFIILEYGDYLVVIIF